jgi:dUTP pyrophosphatase
VPVEYLPHHEGLPPLERMSTGASGFDLPAAVQEDLVIPSGETALVPTGFKIALPRGFEAQVRARSGLALRHRVTVLNGPGTIDADYRGEVQVILVNLGGGEFTVRRGDRVAQLVVQQVPAVTLVPCARVPETARGGGGFGHTGT